MKIEARVERDVTILVPIGDLTIGATKKELREAIGAGLDGNARKFVVDLGRVGYCDSSGIGELVGIHGSVVDRGGAVKLANVPPRVNEILQVTQVARVFEIHGTPAEAAASFA